VDSGLDALRSCYSEKLSLDGFDFKILLSPSPVGLGTESEGGKSFTIRIASCPWYDKLVRSNRAHLAASIGKRICATEYSAWAKEFGCRFEFGEEGKLCEGSSVCVLEFRAI
jgi:hypothetical protein